MGERLGEFKDGANPYGSAPCQDLTLPRFLGCSVGTMIWYVNPKTGRDTQDGCAPDTAFQTVQHAVGAATSGDTIMIAPGAYNQDLPKIISEARAGHINVAVTGSD